MIFSRSFFPVSSFLCSFQCGPVLKWNPPLSLEIPPIGSATYPLGKWRDAVLAGKPWNTTDDERTSTCRIHYPPSQPKCLSMGPPGTQKKSKRGVNRWDRWDRLPFRRAYSMFDTYLQGLFYFLGGGRWDRSISLGKHFVLGKSLECGMFVREYFWPNPLCRNPSNTRLGLLPKGLVLLKALRKVLRGSLHAAYTLWFARICAFGMF